MAPVKIAVLYDFVKNVIKSIFLHMSTHIWHKSGTSCQIQGVQEEGEAGFGDAYRGASEGRYGGGSDARGVFGGPILSSGYV